MKKVLAVFLVLFMVIMMGCGQKTFAYSPIERDGYLTGGGLSFYYDEQSHAAYFGGEGEKLEWYGEDVAKGWKEAGNRIGIKIFPPRGIDDYKSATASINDQQFEYNDFYVGEENRYVIFQPIVREEEPLLTLRITWQEGAEEQIYNIVVRKGTIFMKDEA